MDDQEWEELSQQLYELGPGRLDAAWGLAIGGLLTASMYAIAVLAFRIGRALVG